MKAWEKHLITTVFLLFVIGLIYIAWSMWRTAEDGAYESCLGGLYTNIFRNINESLYMPKEASDSLLPIDGKWRILSEREVDFLAARTPGSDCSRFPEPFRDPWNRRINIALARGINNRVNIVLWSNGGDGLPGTTDDLVVPYGHEIPR